MPRRDRPFEDRTYGMGSSAMIVMFGSVFAGRDRETT